MLKQIITLCAATAVLSLSSCAKKDAESTKAGALATEKDKVSYVFGYNIGKNLKQAETELDLKTLMAGLNFGLNGKDSLMAEKEMMEVMQKFQEDQQKKMMAKFDKVKTDGIAYLAKNKTQPGVITTASGLQYKVITEGKGATPKATDKVKVHYKGTTIEGKEFDSSYKRGEPVEFQADQVIKGWGEALQLMKVGSKVQLVIPSELAYGERGSQPDIMPNSVLVFEVELLDIVK